MKPTHKCKICGALWRLLPDGYWNLVASTCGKCCDNEPMGDQIVPIFAPGDVAYYNDWTHPRKLIVSIHGDVAEVITCWGSRDTLQLRNLSTQAEWVRECERCADGFLGNWKKQVEKHTDPNWTPPREWTDFILANAKVADPKDSAH